MKKLMIAVAIVCAAAYVHAAAGDWSVYSGWNVATADEDPSTLEGLSVYVFDQNVYSSSSLVTALGTVGDLSVLADNKLGTGSIIDGVIDISGGGLTKDASNYSDAYFVIMSSDNKNYYLYDNFDPVLVTDAVAADQVSFSLGINDLVTGEVSSWATVATAAPEPTSGLLLLLGVAGLALRRRRA